MHEIDILSQLTQWIQYQLKAIIRCCVHKKPTLKDLVVIKNKTDTKLVFVSGENGTDINDMRSFKMKAEAKMHGNSIFAGIAAGQQRRLSLEKYGSVHQIIEGYSAIHNKKQHYKYISGLSDSLWEWFCVD